MLIDIFYGHTLELGGNRENRTRVDLGEGWTCKVARKLNAGSRDLLHRAVIEHGEVGDVLRSDLKHGESVISR